MRLAIVFGAAVALLASEPAQAGPARPGMQPVAARSAGSASRSSVNKTERNSRRYRKKLEKEARRDAKAIRDLGKRSRYSKPRQAGGYCMYDVRGNVILQPEGIECESQSGEYMRGQAGPPARVAPRQSGCVDGDCRVGQGVYLWSNGTQYIGGFQRGLQHGQGLLIMPNGSTWEGGWKLGKKHGKGVATYSDGRVKKGTWKDNRYVSRTSSPRIRWPDLSKAPPREIGGGKRDAAVLVGVTRYAHVAEVPGAAANVSDWYAYLVNTRGVPLDRVSLLLDEDATVEEMRFAVEEAARRVRKKGTLWFVFVGHGAPARDGADGLLVGFDAQQKTRSIEARSLRRSELLAALQDSKAAHVQVFLDACFSGKTTTGSQLVAGLQPLVVETPAASVDLRVTLLTAAASNEYAGPLPGASRPAFSYLALGGLRGWADGDRDGRITSGELHGYVTQTMRALVRDRRQRPTLVGENDRRIVESSREKGPDIARFVVDTSRQ